MKCYFEGCRGRNRNGECGADVEAGCKNFIPDDEEIRDFCIESNLWLGEEYLPYFSEGKWRVPFLMDGAGGYGGGVGELSDETLRGVMELAKDKLA